jgi:hypothetical protein
MESRKRSKKVAQDLTRTIELLSDVHDALQKNSYLEEARLVSHHLEQLTSPHTETRVEERGIEPVLEEMARGFTVEKTAAS